MIADLPAVKEATALRGIFSVAVRKPFMHPNIALARHVLIDGVVPIDKVPFLLQARDLSTHEYQSLQFAQDQITGRVVRNFERVFVVNTEGDFILTFGPYLIIDEDTLTNPHYAKVLAHELAHLNNGDSYVKAALWFLGKGWMQEFMSPFGVIKESPEDKLKRSNQVMHDVTTSTLRGIERGGWTMGLLAAGVVAAGNAFSGVGSGVRSLEPEITKYFHDWDVKADALAEQWIGVLEYQAFLRDLDEGVFIGRRPFDASTKVRRATSEDRQTPKLPVNEAVPVVKQPTGCALSTGAIIFLVMVMGTIGFAGFLFLVFIFSRFG